MNSNNENKPVRPSLPIQDSCSPSTSKGDNSNLEGLPLSQLSQHLFWDVELAELDAEKAKSFIIHRVLEYGFMKDWKLINKWYGILCITQTAQNLRDLDPRALTFISVLSGVPKSEFRCYTTKQLIPQHWNF